MSILRFRMIRALPRRPGVRVPRPRVGRAERQTTNARDRGARCVLHVSACFVVAFTAAVSFAQTPTLNGEIIAQLDAREPVTQAWAVERQYTDVGVYEGKAYPATLEDNRLHVEGLPTPGRYFLRLRTASGMVEGWDAHVPPSDYIEEQPLSEEAKKDILQKLSRDFATGFDDHVAVLDIQGNAQNAAVLLSQLRKRPFVGGGYKQGEWVYRVTRWHWINPHEDNWVPDLKRPYFALVRQRLMPAAYGELHVTYARHLGGIALKEDGAAADLGIIVVPAPRPGINAAHPDGSPTTVLMLKGRSEELTAAPSPAAGK